MSQETRVDIYASYISVGSIIGESLTKLSGFYNVGIPLNGYITVDGNQYHDYEPCFYHDHIDTGANGIRPISHEIVGTPYYVHITKWTTESDYTYNFPGKYFLWFKPGSLQTYTQFDI